MSGETEQNVSGWTVDTLYEHMRQMIRDRDAHLAQRFHDLEERLSAEIESQERQTTKALAATDRRFDGVNEFRATLADQATRFMPRTEADSQYRLLHEHMDAATNRLATMMTRAEVETLFVGYNSQSAQRSEGNAEKIDALASRFDRAEGKGTGLTAGWAILVGVVGLVGVVIAIVTSLLHGSGTGK